MCKYMSAAAAGGRLKATAGAACQLLSQGKNSLLPPVKVRSSRSGSAGNATVFRFKLLEVIVGMTFLNPAFLIIPQIPTYLLPKWC
jgi:hypothetical protein